VPGQASRPEEFDARAAGAKPATLADFGPLISDLVIWPYPAAMARVVEPTQRPSPKPPIGFADGEVVAFPTETVYAWAPIPLIGRVSTGV
jgi:hypothetical protein